MTAWCLKLPYLSKLRRNSAGADFQSVRKPTNHIRTAPPESRLRVQGGNINALDAPPTSIVRKITQPCYITWGSLIFLSLLVGGASDPFMLPLCMFSCKSSRLNLK